MNFDDYHDSIEDVFRAKDKLSSYRFSFANHCLCALQVKLYDQWRNNEGGF